LSVAVAQSHAAEAKGRYLDAAFSQFALLHCVLLIQRREKGRRSGILILPNRCLILPNRISVVAPLAQFADILG
jgi:hypothetical protein